MATLCPRCKNPLEIPKPVPDKIRCVKCGTTFKNTLRPKSSPSAPAGENGSAKGAALAAGGGAAAATAQAVADRRAKSMPQTESNPDDQATAERASGGGMGKVLILAGVAALLIGGAVAAYVIFKNPSDNKPDDVAVKKDKDNDKDSKENKFNLNQHGNGGPVALTPDQKEAKRHNEAVKKGQEYLRQVLHNGLNGHREHLAGRRALIGLTLLETGAKVDDPDVQDVAIYVRDNFRDMEEPYDIAPAIWFLDRLHQPPDDGGDAKVKDAKKKPRPPIPEKDRLIVEHLAVRLVSAQQGDQHFWRYKSRPLTDENKRDLLVSLASNQFRPFYADQTGADISCAQFASLALWTARRNGVPTDPSLRAAAQTALEMQYPAGGWTYMRPRGPTDAFRTETMSLCGTILVALGRAIDAKDGKKDDIMKDPSIDKAIKYVGALVSSKDADPTPYFLWTLERTMLILGQEKIAGVDWHKWGTDIILRKQKEDGSWGDDFGNVVTNAGFKGDPMANTCFCLLFLKKANLFKDLSDKLSLLLSIGNSDLALSQLPIDHRRRGG